MIHELLSNPQVHEKIQTLLVDLAMLAGSLVAILIGQAAKAIRDSHLGIVQKMVAERLVKYAEQTIEQPGPEKLAYVVANLKAKFPNLDEDELNHMAEAAVKSMRDAAQAQGGTDAQPS